MSVTDETYVSAYRGIIAAKGDSVNTINEIGGNLTAGSLYNILGYNVGVLKNILNEFDYEVNGTTVTIKNGQAICYGYVGRLTNPIDFTLIAPSSSDKYYFIVADFDLKTSTIADFSIGLFNNNNSDSYTPTYLDNLNENETGRYQYKLYMIKIDTSSVITVTDLRDIKETVKNAENAVLNTDGSFSGLRNNSTTDVLTLGTEIISKKILLWSGTKIYSDGAMDISSLGLAVGDIIEIEVLNVSNAGMSGSNSVYQKMKLINSDVQYFSFTFFDTGNRIVQYYGLVEVEFTDEIKTILPYPFVSIEISSGGVVYNGHISSSIILKSIWKIIE